MKTLLIAAFTTSALFASDTTLAAGRSPSASASHKVHPSSISGRAAVLYDQNDDDSGISVVSQNFEAANDDFDSQAADDFVVPRKRVWKVTGVDVTGAYFNGAGPAASQNVTFYKNAGDRPGAVLKTFKNVAGVDNGTGSFAIDLGKGVKLPAGKYWVSVQANLDFATGGEWGWENRLTQAKKFAANWQNPRDGFGTGCTAYEVETVCVQAGQGPDHMFALRGKETKK